MTTIEVCTRSSSSSVAFPCKRLDRRRDTREEEEGSSGRNRRRALGVNLRRTSSFSLSLWFSLGSSSFSLLLFFCCLFLSWLLLLLFSSVSQSSQDKDFWKTTSISEGRTRFVSSHVSLSHSLCICLSPGVCTGSSRRFRGSVS